MKYLFVISLTLLNSIAWATGDDGIFDRGNGGDVVICTLADGRKTFQLLDIYEQEKSGLTPVKFPSDLKFSDLVLQQINRIGRRLPRVKTALMYEYIKLSESLYFTDDKNVPEIQDEETYTINNNCVLRQLAVQWGQSSPHGRIYLINTHYFLSLDTHNRAALLLHELVYRLFSMHYPRQSLTSREVRQYVRFFLSEEFDHFATILFPEGFLINNGIMYDGPNRKLFLNSVSK